MKDLAERETEWTIKRVLPLVPKGRAVKKADFEAILDEIVMCLHRNRKVDVETIVAKTKKVLSDLPNDIGQLPEDWRSWTLLIGYLYAKYLKELDLL